MDLQQDLGSLSKIFTRLRTIDSATDLAEKWALALGFYSFLHSINDSFSTSKFNRFHRRDKSIALRTSCCLSQ